MNDDRATTLARIAGCRAPLKIVLKTRDDPFFLNDWIAHHAALVGHENLVVLDNGSTDPDVVATYATIGERTPILHVGGYYNDVHVPARVPELYEALHEGSDHFLFVDTDEFLAWSDGHAVRVDPGSLALLAERVPGDFIPTTRLNCVELYRNRFAIGCDEVALRRQLKWSKPIVRSASTGWPEMINCNLHLRGSLTPHPASGFFILHLAHLSPEQRIRNNVNKLIGRGFMTAGEPLDDVIRRAAPDDAWMIGIYLEEIRRMLALQNTGAPDDAPLGPGTMKIEASGALAFASDLEATVFRDYIDGFAERVQTVLIEGRYPPA